MKNKFFVVIMLAVAAVIAPSCAGLSSLSPVLAGDMKMLKADIQEYQAKVDQAVEESTTGAELANAVADANSSLIASVASTADAANKRAKDALSSSPITGNPLVDLGIGLVGMILTGGATYKTTMAARDNNRRKRHERVGTERVDAAPRTGTGV